MNKFFPIRIGSMALLAIGAAMATPAPTLAVEPTNFIALSVRGAVEHPLNLSVSELNQMPRTKLTAGEKDGTKAEFEGVALSEIVNRARPTLTTQCCSNAANTIVVVRAVDGYRALFSLPELDAGFTDDKILLADRRDNQPLGTVQGPLRIVVPKDKTHARWVRQVNAIEIQIVGASTNSPAH